MNRLKTLVAAVAVCISLTSAAQKQKPQLVDFAAQYAQSITPTGLKEKLTVLASAEMEGRETAMPGQKKAAAYIEASLQKAKLQPGMGSSYQMQFPIYQDTLIEASLKAFGKPYKLDEDFYLDIASAQTGTYDIREIMYASYGLKDSSRNDYKDIDVQGKWVLIMEGGTGAYNIHSKIKTLQKLGAKGVFIMSADLPRETASEPKGKMYMKRGEVMSMPSIYVSSTLAHDLIGMNPNQLLQSLKNIPTGAYNANAQFVISKRTLMMQSSNVVGVVPGTDKKDEYVIITAHYDHLGKRGKDIYYGADDDGSGTASVIQLAEAFAKAQQEGHGPRRTMVFMTVSGEEKGLFGSEFYSEHPWFPLAKTSVDLNIDMVGRIDPKYRGDTLNYLYIIGDDKLSSDLRPTTDSLNNLYTKLQLDRKYNDIKDLNRFYYRSDHYNFARKGVPVIFYFNGTHADYHRPTDTVDKINFDLMAKRVKLVFFTAWDIANREGMMKRDIALPKDL